MLKKDGIALIAVLGLLVVVGGLIALIGTRMVNEIQTDGDDIAIVQTLALARGGAHLGAELLENPIEAALDNVVDQVSRVTNGGSRWTFDPIAGRGDRPDAGRVANDLASLADTVQNLVDSNLCVPPTAIGGGSVNIKVHFVSRDICANTTSPVSLPPGVELPDGRYVKGPPRNGTGSTSVQTYALPFVLVSEGVVGEYERQVVIQGEYHIQVGAGSFARYALFTNKHQSAGGAGIWFTDNTLFDGPVHTNNFFRFYREPWFGGEVTSASCLSPTDDACGDGGTEPGARFYGQGYVKSGNMANAQRPSFNNRWGTHAPDFREGINWNAGYIELPSNNLDQEAAAFRAGPAEPHAGLHIDRDSEVLQMWAADINGNALIKNSDGDWVPRATFQYIRECQDDDQQNCTTYRYRENINGVGDAYPELQESDGAGGWRIREREFNGMIFVNGKIERLQGPPRTPVNSNDDEDAPPALASFAKITVAADDDIRITGDLKYEDPPCTGSPTRGDNGVTPAVCDNLRAENVLGVFTPEGDVLIGNANTDQTLNAPFDLAVHAVLMSSSDAVTVENHDRGRARGSMKLLGGMIENFYGAFGTFDPRTGGMKTGYSRQFTYDQRMADGLAPPFFPTIAEEDVKNAILFSFGQREQLN